MAADASDRPPLAAAGRPAHRTPPAAVGPTRRQALAAGLGAGAVLAVSAVAAAPRPGRLGEPTGDRELAGRLAPRLRGHRRVAAVLREADGSVRTAGLGAEAMAEFEVGSVTKTFTAALLMEGVARGEIALDSTVQDVLGEEAAGSAIADVRMEELAAHTSGLPRLPSSLLLPALPARLLRRDPYAGHDPQDVIAEALAVSPDGRGEKAYSNLGVSLLGQLVARAGGSSWEDLLAERILAPMGMAATSAPITAEGLRPGAPRGRTASGLRAGAWTCEGYAPSGGLRSTAADLRIWLASMIDGSNPGAQGLEPIHRDESPGGSSTAVVWVRTPTADGATDIIWHNGMTGGFAAFCGWREDTGRGLVLLSDTALSVDDLAMAVLEGTVAV